ncbi:hypothetical protein OTU49_015240, partial [Cherax quadricarinatus]
PSWCGRSHTLSPSTTLSHTRSSSSSSSSSSSPLSPSFSSPLSFLSSFPASLLPLSKSYQLVPTSCSFPSASSETDSSVRSSRQQQPAPAWSTESSSAEDNCSSTLPPPLTTSSVTPNPRRLYPSTSSPDQRPRSASIPQSPSICVSWSSSASDSITEGFPRSVSLPDSSLEEHLWRESLLDSPTGHSTSWSRLLPRSHSSLASLSGSPSYVSLDSSPPSSPPSSPQGNPGGFNMPRPLAQSALMRPLVALALPGMYLVYKYNQYKRQQQEANRRKAAERELAQLNHKI